MTNFAFYDLSLLQCIIKLFADNCLLYKTIKSPQDAIDVEQDLFAMQT